MRNCKSRQGSSLELGNFLLLMLVEAFEGKVGGLRKLSSIAVVGRVALTCAIPQSCWERCRGLLPALEYRMMAARAVPGVENGLRGRVFELSRLFFSMQFGM